MAYSVFINLFRNVYTFIVSVNNQNLQNFTINAEKEIN